MPAANGKLSRLSLDLTVRHSKSIATKNQLCHYSDGDDGARGR